MPRVSPSVCGSSRGVARRDGSKRGGAGERMEGGIKEIGMCTVVVDIFTVVLF